MTDREGSPQPVCITVAERANDVIDLQRIWRALLQGKWQIVSITVVFTAAAVAYALLATPIYRAEIVLTPVLENPFDVNAGGLSGLASIAGINFGRGRKSAEAIAALESKKFLEEFIQEKQLLPVLFSEEWDSEHRRWRSNSKELQPDLRDGVRVFSEQVRTVAEDGRTGLVTLSVTWIDPEVAAQWASELVERINERIRRRDIQDIELKLEYLRKELDTAALVQLRQAISRVIEEQVTAMMLAQTQTEYAFRVIDPAIVPKQRAWPKRTLIVIVATALGGFVGSFFVLMRASNRD